MSQAIQLNINPDEFNRLFSFEKIKENDKYKNLTLNGYEKLIDNCKSIARLIFEGYINKEKMD